MRIKSLRPALIAGVALTALVCSIAGFAVFPESAIAAPNSVRVSPASASASPGGNVTLDVVAEAPAAKLGAWDLRISFTDSVIQLTSPATPCTGQSNCNLISPGVLGVNGYNASGLSGTQTLASIQFTAVGSAGQSSDVGIQVIDFTDPNSAETNPTIAGGHVTIQVTPTPSPSPSPSPTHTPTPTATPTPTPTATHTATPTFTLTPTPTATPTPGTSSTTSQTASPTGTPSPTPSPTQLTDESGDMNCDGSTNPSDVLTLLEYLLGLVSHIGNCPSS